MVADAVTEERIRKFRRGICRATHSLDRPRHANNSSYPSSRIETMGSGYPSLSTTQISVDLAASTTDQQGRRTDEQQRHRTGLGYTRHDRNARLRFVSPGKCVKLSRMGSQRISHNADPSVLDTVPEIELNTKVSRNAFRKQRVCRRNVPLPPRVTCASSPRYVGRRNQFAKFDTYHVFVKFRITNSSHQAEFFYTSEKYTAGSIYLMPHRRRTWPDVRLLVCWKREIQRNERFPDIWMPDEMPVSRGIFEHNDTGESVRCGKQDRQHTQAQYGTYSSFRAILHRSPPLLAREFAIVTLNFRQLRGGYLPVDSQQRNAKRSALVCSCGRLGILAVQEWRVNHVSDMACASDFAP